MTYGNLLKLKPRAHFHIPLYNGQVMVFTRRKAFITALRALKVPEDDDEDSCLGMCVPCKNDMGTRLYVMGWFDREASTLVHECGHLAFFVTESAGMDARDSCGEAFCYILDHVFSQAMDGHGDT